MHAQIVKISAHEITKQIEGYIKHTTSIIYLEQATTVHINKRIRSLYHRPNRIKSLILTKSTLYTQQNEYYAEEYRH